MPSEPMPYQGSSTSGQEIGCSAMGFQGCSTTEPDRKNIYSKDHKSEIQTGLVSSISTTRPDQTENSIRVREDRHRGLENGLHGGEDRLRGRGQQVRRVSISQRAGGFGANAHWDN